MNPGSFPARVTTGERWERLLSGLTRSEFCKKTGVERATLCNWARGRNLPLQKTVARIATRLGRDPGEVGALLADIVGEARARAAGGAP
jgi:transcriptional regulator with XRE-family HTH domain